MDAAQDRPVALPSEDFSARLRREPCGVVGLIVPWNFPMVTTAWKLAPALAAGCCVVLKPSEVTPLAELQLARIIAEAGFPAGVFNLVCGTGLAVGAPLAADRRVAKISFTGSNAVGVQVMQRAAETVKGVSLFLAIDADDIQWPEHSPMQAAYGNTTGLLQKAHNEAKHAMDQFELELGPLPHWASAHHITGEPVLYAQLYTRNPRACGNGLIYHIGDSGDTFGIITDIGNTMIVNREEMDQYFEIGDFIMNEDAYMKRYRQRDDYVEPPVRGL